MEAKALKMGNETLELQKKIDSLEILVPKATSPLITLEEQKKKARDILFQNYSNYDEKVDKYGRFDLPASNPYLPAKCVSNPELDVYIKKPKFSRDQFSYNVSRDHYEDKFATMEAGSLDQLLTIIMSQNTELALRKFAALGTKIYLGEALEITAPILSISQ